MLTNRVSRWFAALLPASCVAVALWSSGPTTLTAEERGAGCCTGLSAFSCNPNPGQCTNLFNQCVGSAVGTHFCTVIPDVNPCPANCIFVRRLQLCDGAC
jgi:hypothetical protein